MSWWWARRFTQKPIRLWKRAIGKYCITLFNCQSRMSSRAEPRAMPWDMAAAAACRRTTQRKMLHDNRNHAPAVHGAAVACCRRMLSTHRAMHPHFVHPQTSWSTVLSAPHSVVLFSLLDILSKHSLVSIGCGWRVFARSVRHQRCHVGDSRGMLLAFLWFNWWQR